RNPTSAGFLATGTTRLLGSSRRAGRRRRSGNSSARESTREPTRKETFPEAAKPSGDAAADRRRLGPRPSREDPPRPPRRPAVPGKVGAAGRILGAGRDDRGILRPGSLGRDRPPGADRTGPRRLFGSETRPARTHGERPLRRDSGRRDL